MSGPDDADQWVTTERAAAALGLSDSGFRALARREGIAVRRRGRLPGVLRTSLESYLERAKIAPRRPLPPVEPDRIPAAEAARRLGVSRQRFWEVAARGGIRRTRVEGGWGVGAADIDALLSRSPMQPRSRESRG